MAAVKDLKKQTTGTKVLHRLPSYTLNQLSKARFIAFSAITHIAKIKHKLISFAGWGQSTYHLAVFSTR